MAGIIGLPDFPDQLGRALGQGDLDLCTVLVGAFHAAASVDELIDGFAGKCLDLPRSDRRSLALFLAALANRAVEQDLMAAGAV